MTIQELYSNIGGNYDQAVRIMKSDRLIGKYVLKFEASRVGETLAEAGETMDPVQLFETSHAMKGVCYNLGLITLAELASELSEEFRPGKPRRHSDEEVAALIAKIAGLYSVTAEGIRAYEASL